MVPIGVAISRRNAHDVALRIWPHKVVPCGRPGLVPRAREDTMCGVRCTEEDLTEIQARLQTVGRHLEGPDQHPDLVPDELRRLQAQPVSGR